MSIKFIGSAILVKDINKSRSFYEELLGQKVMFDHGPNVAFENGFSIWLVDHANEIIFGKKQVIKDKLGRNNWELYFETEDIKAEFKRLTDAKVRFVHPVHEAPWGQRTFRVYDPDSHIVEIGEPMPVVIQRFLSEGMTEEEVAKMTFMPLGVVQAIAKK